MTILQDMLGPLGPVFSATGAAAGSSLNIMGQAALGAAGATAVVDKPDHMTQIHKNAEAHIKAGDEKIKEALAAPAPK